MVHSKGESPPAGVAGGKTFVPEGDPLVVGIDETLERRQGKRIVAKGI